MSTLAKNYFLDLFQRKNSNTAPVVNAICQSITDIDNASLTAPFSKEEFKDAIFSMHPDKCPGPDGYKPGFYQYFWSSCSEDIFKDCCEWLETSQFPTSMNDYSSYSKGKHSDYYE